MKLSSLSNRPIARRACVPLIVAVICFVAAERGAMQAPNPADGPWSGSAQCVLTGQFAGQGQSYSNQQTHTWVLTSSTPGPTSTSDIKQYAATWQVTGQGTRQRGQGNNTDQWTTAGVPMPDTITIRLAGGTIHFSGAAQLRSVGTTTGISLPYVDEWPFPAIEGTATQTTISGSAASASPANFSGAPPGTAYTVTCSWNFVRGGGAAPQPTGITRDARGALAGVIPGGTASGTALGGAETVNPSPIPTAATVTAPASQETLSPASPIKAPIGPIGGLTADQPKSTQDLIGSCTLRGPGVNSYPYSSYATGVMANLYWTPVGGATGYIVLRSDLGLLTPMPLPPTATLYHHSAILQLGSTYVYIVAAQYPQGCGATAFNLKASVGSMDAFLTTTGPGLSAGTVMLTVTAPSYGPSYVTFNYSGFHVEGPGLPQGGRDARWSSFSSSPQRGQLQITGVPSGSQRWSVTAYWDTSQGRINGVSASATGSVP